MSLLLLCAAGCDDTEEDASPTPPANNQDNDAGQDLDDGGAPDPNPGPNPTPSPDVGNPEDVGMDAEPTPEPEDASNPDEDAPEACLAFNVLAESALLPVDIVWIIDASPSMGEEIAIIEENLNVFADRIGASALDYRVVIIGSDRDYCGEAQCYLPICVPPPLSAEATCPDVDSDRYRHIREGVHSRDGLDVTIATADRWLDFLRPEALTHFVMVTDDNSGFGADADDFAAFMAQNTATLGTVRFHSIVDLVGYQPGCGVFDDEECSCGEERGQTYIDLSERTEGLVQSVCEEDWDPIFESLETRVREGTELPCTFQIPSRATTARSILTRSTSSFFRGSDLAHAHPAGRRRRGLRARRGLVLRRSGGPHAHPPLPGGLRHGSGHRRGRDRLRDGQKLTPV